MNNKKIKFCKNCGRTIFISKNITYLKGFCSQSCYIMFNKKGNRQLSEFIDDKNNKFNEKK